jgi:hypothetical protein
MAPTYRIERDRGSKEFPQQLAALQAAMRPAFRRRPHWLGADFDLFRSDVAGVCLGACRALRSGFSMFCKRIVSTCLMVLCSPARAQDDPVEFQLYHIVNAENDVLALRTEPSFQKGLEIMRVSNGTLLEVVERRKDRWWYVRLLPFGQEGWALSGRGSRRWIECCRARQDIPLPIALEQSIGFKTPTSNVYCVIEETWLRCDTKQIAGSNSQKPAECYLDWGDAFIVTPESEGGHFLCHGDTVADDALPTLRYGNRWTREGYTCTSERTAVTCTNAQGHGFRLSSTSKTVF